MSAVNDNTDRIRLSLLPRALHEHYTAPETLTYLKIYRGVLDGSVAPIEHYQGRWYFRDADLAAIAKAFPKLKPRNTKPLD